MPDYAPHGVWSSFHASNNEEGDDLNAQGCWAQQLLPFLVNVPSQCVLDLGCGTGGDALLLSRKEYSVIGLDYSEVAVKRAAAKASRHKQPANFMVADLGSSLPYAPEAFGAVMGNVALHMFSDTITRAIFKEVRRIIQPGGVFMFHVNSTQQMKHRKFKRVQEIEPDFYLEEQGGTMRFFTETYCRDLLQNWTIVSLQHLELQLKLFANRSPITKCVWQGIARKNIG